MRAPAAVTLLLLASCSAIPVGNDRRDSSGAGGSQPAVDGGMGGGATDSGLGGGTSSSGGASSGGHHSGGQNSAGQGSAGHDSGAPGCAALSCDHGRCEAQASGAACVCDEGYTGAECADRSADYGRRVKLVEDLADPDVLAMPDGSYVLSGTQSSVDLGFWRSTDLTKWDHTATYNPSAADPAHDYCAVWAPDITFEDGALTLYFSAYQGPKGNTHCPWPSSADVTTFRTVSLDGGLSFGPPQLLFPAANPNQEAHSRTAAGCPGGGCGLAIRIDAASFAGRLYYVFFNQGNNVASVARDNPGDFWMHTGPATSALQPYEERINEAPEVFPWGNRYYLFFSAGWFNSQYATFYIVADQPAALVRGAGVHRLTTPVRRGNDALLETHGHNSVAVFRGEPFNFFHIGVFDGNGNLVRRDTHRQRLVVAADGRLLSQNQVTLSWNDLGGGNTYSLDLVLRSGETIGPCISAGRIRSNLSAIYAGACPDAGDRLVHKSEVAAFRLYAAPGSNFQLVGEAAYDGYSDALNLNIAQP